MWNQVYNPFNNTTLSTLAAAIPVVSLLVMIASGKVKVHIAAIVALVLANLVAIFLFTMPAEFVDPGIAAWRRQRILPDRLDRAERHLHVPAHCGRPAALRHCKRAIGGVTADRRLQLLLIAFSFGAFFEGASGFGTPVAITGAILIGLGFSPLAASGLSLIANTAPVAYGALGTPIQGLASVTGLDPYLLGAMVGRQLPIFSLIVPFWVVWAFAGWKGMKEVWPAILVTGISFAIPQFLISNYINPWIVDIGASLISMGCLILFLKVWQPKVLWTVAGVAQPRRFRRTMPPREAGRSDAAAPRKSGPSLLPWIIVCAVLLIWGTGWFKAAVNPIFTWNYAVPELHNMINKVQPVVPTPTTEGAVFAFTYLSFTGTGMLMAAIISGLVMGLSPGQHHHGVWPHHQARARIR